MGRQKDHNAETKNVPLEPEVEEFLKLVAHIISRHLASGGEIPHNLEYSKPEPKG